MIKVRHLCILLFCLFIKPEQISSRSLIESEDDGRQYQPVEVEVECEEENEEEYAEQRGRYARTQQEQGINFFQF